MFHFSTLIFMPHGPFRPYFHFRRRLMTSRMKHDLNDDLIGSKLNRLRLSPRFKTLIVSLEIVIWRATQTPISGPKWKFVEILVGIGIKNYSRPIKLKLARVNARITLRRVVEKSSNFYVFKLWSLWRTLKVICRFAKRCIRANVISFFL